MSHVIKLYGYREEEINEFVDEQKGRDAGRWERKVQCQAVKIKGILITYGYAKEKLTFQGRKEGAEELANLFTGVTLRKREAWKVQQQEASESSERKATKKYDWKAAFNEEHEYEEYDYSGYPDYESDQEGLESDMCEWRLNNSSNLGRWIGEVNEEEEKALEETERDEKQESKWSRR